MIPHGQATHDFLNLELRHHQYVEIIVIILKFLSFEFHVFLVFETFTAANLKK